MNFDRFAPASKLNNELAVLALLNGKRYISLCGSLFDNGVTGRPRLRQLNDVAASCAPRPIIVGLRTHAPHASRRARQSRERRSDVIIKSRFACDDVFS